MAERGNSTVQFDSEAAARLQLELRTVFLSGRTKSYEWRETQLKMMLKLTTECEDQICKAIQQDINKPEFECFVHEITAIKGACTLALKELKNWMKPEKVKSVLASFPSSAEIVPEPLGVVLVISAWNYPFLLALDPMVGAIAAGNAVVLKPSEVSPATSNLLAKLLPKYLDNAAIRVVEGAVPETTHLLEQQWDKIFYTGSGKVARIVMAAAAKHLTPVSLELGGKSPAVVDSNINVDIAAKRIISGKWGFNNGQACISPDYILTTKSFAPKLVDALKRNLEQFYGKDPFQSNDTSRIITSDHFHRLSKLLDDEKVVDKIIHGGQRDERQLKIAPTLLLDVPNDSLIMGEEIFGPLLPIITVDDLEESFELIKLRPKPLAAYIFTQNKKLEKAFIESISAGAVVVNDTTIHLIVHTLPFGGVGDSGMGSYHGKFSFDAFSHKKAVLHRGYFCDLSARYAPYTRLKQSVINALLRSDIIGLIRIFLWWPRT